MVTFSRAVGRLYLFSGEMFVQVHCLFFSWAVELSEAFIKYSGFWASPAFSEDTFAWV